MFLNDILTKAMYETSLPIPSGQMPLLISMPHVGTEIAPDNQQQLLPIAEQKGRYGLAFAATLQYGKALGASVIQAEYSRYVIDLNRSSDDSNLYPGQDTTGLIPLDTFDKQALYPSGNTPSETEVQKRVQTYWLPYHSKLQDELERIRTQHGVAVLWDAHSIASVVPRFFAGKLPDLNFGTADGKSSDASLQEALAKALVGVHIHMCSTGDLKVDLLQEIMGSHLAIFTLCNWK